VLRQIVMMFLARRPKSSRPESISQRNFPRQNAYPSEHAGRMAGSALGDPRFGLSLRWFPFAQWTYALKLCIREWKR
jgi:hypothetical protein